MLNSQTPSRAGNAPPQRFAVWSAVALAVLLFFAVLTDWVQQRWALSLFQAGVFAMAIGWGVLMVVRPYKLRGSILLIPLGGTVVWGLLQLATHQTEYRFETWDAVLGWSTNFVVLLLTLQILRFSAIRRRFRDWLLCFGFVVGVVSVTQFFTSEGKIFWMFPTPYQVIGPFLNRDHYASFIALVLPLAVYQALADRKKQWAYAAVAGAMFATVIAGASRAGAILVTAEIVILLPLVIGGAGSRRGPAAILTRIVLFAALFTAVVGWEVLWKRFQAPDPFRFRREMLYSSMSMACERPWTGFGLGTWPFVYPAHAIIDEGVFVNHAHNDWAEWASEGGVPMVLLLLSILAWSVRYSFRFPWGVGVVAVFVHSLVDFPLQKPSLTALLFAMLGTMAASRSGHGPATQPKRPPMPPSAAPFAGSHAGDVDR